MRTARWTLANSFVFVWGGYQLLLFGALLLAAVSIVQAMYFPLPRQRTGRGLGPPPVRAAVVRCSDGHIPPQIRGSAALILREP